MSMHIAICGQTSFQRLLHKSSKGSARKEIIEYTQRQKMFKRTSVGLENFVLFVKYFMVEY